MILFPYIPLCTDEFAFGGTFSIRFSMTEKKRIEYFFAITLLAQCINSLEGRSPFRPKEEWLPMISVQWAHESEKFSVSNAHLEEYPYFKIFDNNFFNEHLIKDTP